MPVVWERSGDAFYADVETSRGDRYFLIVERLPGGGWEWSVWRQRDNWRLARGGTADTVHEAMREAEATTT